MGMRWINAAAASALSLTLVSCGGAPPPAATAGAPSASPATDRGASTSPQAAKASAKGGRTDAAKGKPNRKADAEPPILPCAPDTPAHRIARDAFDKLHVQIEALAPDGDPGPAHRALLDLLSKPCFLIAEAEHPVSLEPDSGLALKAFWSEGGKWWVQSYLELGKPRSADVQPTSVVPPSMRSTLTKESSPGHPLADLLCSVKDPSCGQATRGWMRRADQAFRAFAEKARGRFAYDDAHPELPKTAKRCNARAKKLPPAKRYAEWHACVSQVPIEVSTLPLGAFRAPTEGWLIIRGRRGHYSFCDELRAYDLATGAGYVARSCSSLALREGGSVDHAATDGARKLDVTKGSLPLANLREAAWMILLADAVDKPALHNSEGFPIPEHIPIRRDLDGFSGNLVGSFGASSAHTRLSWSYLRGKRVVKRGALTYPSDYNEAGRDHAVQLLDIAEQGYVAGCPPARLPTKVNFRRGFPGVSSLDASRRKLTATHQELADAMEGLRKGRVCRLRRR